MPIVYRFIAWPVVAPGPWSVVAPRPSFLVEVFVELYIVFYSFVLVWICRCRYGLLDCLRLWSFWPQEAVGVRM